MQQSTAQHSTAQHSTAQHSTAQHSTAQHSTAQHSTAQHSTAQHTLPSAIIRLMQLLQGFTYWHQYGSLHSELASGPCADCGAVRVMPSRQSCCHCMVHTSHCLHDACCQGGYVEHRPYLHKHPNRNHIVASTKTSLRLTWELHLLTELSAVSVQIAFCIAQQIVVMQDCLWK